MNWIEHICEPRHLILAWQAPDEAGDRSRWAVAEIKRDDGGLTLGYFDEGDFAVLNPGKTLGDIERLGYRGYPGFRPSKKVYRTGVYQALMRRLPPRSRPDFAEYREHFRLKPDTAISDFALLGCTEAKLPSDGFSLVNPLDCTGDKFDLMLEIAGHRYYAHAAPPIKIGEAVSFVAEPENEYDPNAIQICLQGVRIGYVNRLQVQAFHRWIANNQIDAVVERVNGNPARPRVFVFVRVRPKMQRQAA